MITSQDFRDEACFPLLRIEVNVDGRTAIVRLTGELDVAGAEQVAEALKSAFGETVVVDLSDLTFVDAQGVSPLGVNGCRWERDSSGRKEVH
jgi:anti-anti-sigma factor